MKKPDFYLPAPRQEEFLVYAILCEGGSIYVGHTKNLQKRWCEHCQGVGAAWTKKHKPTKMVHIEKFKSREEAVIHERSLKTGFGRKWLKRIVSRVAAGRQNS